MADDTKLKGERITVSYIPLEDAVLWDRNPKLHDIPSLVESIWRYGLVDPPKYDAKLGALVYGNGRVQALLQGKAEGRQPPRGVLYDEDGNWYIPVKFGVDAESQAVAEALAIDHNMLTLSGAPDLDFCDQLNIWDQDGIAGLLDELAQQNLYAVTLGPSAVQMLAMESAGQKEVGVVPYGVALVRAGVLAWAHPLVTHVRLLFEPLAAEGALRHGLVAFCKGPTQPVWASSVVSVESSPGATKALQSAFPGMYYRQSDGTLASRIHYPSLELR